MIYQENSYKLDCNTFYAGDKIHFELRNNRWPDPLECAVELVSGSENTSPKPKIFFLKRSKEIEHATTRFLRIL